ncbi:hypothetical protein F5879DRAFT_1071103 [Lentinula edodes]|nr:hypothetical protein F5879DRAFT_1071103 [Lentinula edodes]
MSSVPVTQMPLSQAPPGNQLMLASMMLNPVDPTQESNSDKDIDMGEVLVYDSDKEAVEGELVGSADEDSNEQESSGNENEMDDAKDVGEVDDIGNPIVELTTEDQLVEAINAPVNQKNPIESNQAGPGDEDVIMKDSVDVDESISTAKGGKRKVSSKAKGKARVVEEPPLTEAPDLSVYEVASTHEAIDHNKYLLGYAMVNVVQERCGGAGVELIGGPGQRELSASHVDVLYEQFEKACYNTVPENAITIVLADKNIDLNSLQMVQGAGWQDICFTNHAANATGILAAGHHRVAASKKRLAEAISEFETCTVKLELRGGHQQDIKFRLENARHILQTQGKWLAAFHSHEGILKDLANGPAILTRLCSNAQVLSKADTPETHFRKFMLSVNMCKTLEARQQVYQMTAMLRGTQELVAALVKDHSEMFEEYARLTPLPSLKRDFAGLDSFKALSGGLWRFLFPLLHTSLQMLYLLVDPNQVVKSPIADELQSSLLVHIGMKHPGAGSNHSADSYLAFRNDQVIPNMATYATTFFSQLSPMLKKFLDCLVEEVFEPGFMQHLSSEIETYAGPPSKADNWSSSYLEYYMKDIGRNAQTVADDFVEEFGDQLSASDRRVISNIRSRISIYGVHPITLRTQGIELSFTPFLCPSFITAMIAQVVEAHPGLNLTVFLIQPGLHTAICRLGRASNRVDSYNSIPFGDRAEAIAYALAYRSVKATQSPLLPIEINSVRVKFLKIAQLFFVHRHVFKQYATPIRKALPDVLPPKQVFATEYASNLSLGSQAYHTAVDRWRFAAKAQLSAQGMKSTTGGIPGLDRVLPFPPSNVKVQLSRIPSVGSVTWVESLRHIGWPWLQYGGTAKRSMNNPLPTDTAIFEGVYYDMILLDKFIAPLLHKSSLANFHRELKQVIPSPWIDPVTKEPLCSLWVGPPFPADQCETDLLEEGDGEKDEDDLEYDNRLAKFDHAMAIQVKKAKSIYANLDKQNLRFKRGKKTISVAHPEIVKQANNLVDLFIGNAVYVESYNAGIKEPLQYIMLDDEKRAQFKVQYQKWWDMLDAAVQVADPQEVTAFDKAVADANTGHNQCIAFGDTDSQKWPIPLHVIGADDKAAGKKRKAGGDLAVASSSKTKLTKGGNKKSKVTSVETISASMDAN